MRKWQIVSKVTGEIVATVEAEDYVSSIFYGVMRWLFIGDNEEQLQFVGNVEYYEVRAS